MIAVLAQALLTAVGIGLVGLVGAAVLGLRGTDIARHVSFGFFSAMVTLLAHSMMMFYLIGKGKAVKDAMVEGGLTGDHYRRIAAGPQAGVFDRHARHGRHDRRGDPRRQRRYGRAAADCPRDARLRRDRLQSSRRSKSKSPPSPRSSRIVDEVNHLLGS